MKKTKLSLLFLLPLMIGALSGCTRGEPTSEPTSQQSSGGQSESQSTQPEVKSVRIKFWHTFGQTVVDGLKSKIDTFKGLVKQNDGVDVDVELIYQGGYDDVAYNIRNGYSVNNKPTIAVAYPDHIADYLEIGKSAGEEFVVNLDKFINSDTVGFGKEAWLTIYMMKLISSKISMKKVVLISFLVPIPYHI